MEFVEKVNQAFQEELDKIDEELLNTVDIQTYLICKTKLFILNDLAQKIGVDYRIISRIAGKLK